MQIFKRSQLTADMLKQWEREAASDWILETATSIFDLSMTIADKTDGKVDMKDNGEIWVDGLPFCNWRKDNGRYIAYSPTHGQNNTPERRTCAKIIHGPWK